MFYSQLINRYYRYLVQSTFKHQAEAAVIIPGNGATRTDIMEIGPTASGRCPVCPVSYPVQCVMTRCDRPGLTIVGKKAEAET